MRNFPFKLQNVKAGWKSTVLGIVAILGGIASVFYVPANIGWGEASIIISLGVSLVFAKPEGSKVFKTVLLLSVLQFTSSCITYDKCYEKFGTVSAKDSIVTVHDTIVIDSTVTIPGDSILVTVNTKLVDNFVQESNNGQVRLQYWKDQYGRLKIKCASKDNTYQFNYSINRQVAVNIGKPVRFAPPAESFGFWQKVRLVLISSFITLVLIIAVSIIKKLVA